MVLKYARSWKVMTIPRKWSKISRKHERLVSKGFLSLCLMVNMPFLEHNQSMRLIKYWIKYGKRNKLINQYTKNIDKIERSHQTCCYYIYKIEIAKILNKVKFR